MDCGRNKLFLCLLCGKRSRVSQWHRVNEFANHECTVYWERASCAFEEGKCADVDHLVAEFDEIVVYDEFDELNENAIAWIFIWVWIFFPIFSPPFFKFLLLGKKILETPYSRVLAPKSPYKKTLYI